jgi:hypothetical protein
MDAKVLIEKIASGVTGVPDRAEVLGLRLHSIDEIERRAKHLLATVGEAFHLPVGRTDWVEKSGHTVIRMPGGSRAVYYHASGAMKVVSGLEPMEALFSGVDKRDALEKLIEHAAARLNLREFISRNEAVRFERLWQIKAMATSREGMNVHPVLCRVVGAYRHIIGGLPVWGPASVVLKLAGGGRFDSLAVNLRETTGEVIDRANILSPELAAQRIVLQLQALVGKSKINLDEAAKVDWSCFGYLSLARRKAQSVLAPVFIASISIVGQDEAQGYVLATPATEKSYLSLVPCAHEAPISRNRTADTLNKVRRVKTFDKLAAFGQVA